VKIADFGTSKLAVVANHSSASTTRHKSKHKSWSKAKEEEVEEWELSDSIFSQMTKNVGSLLYMAPELGDPTRRHIRYGTEVDVYSFGITLWVIARGNGEQPYQQFNKMIEVAEFVEARGRPPVEREWGWPPGLEDLVRECWAHNPASRPVFPKILQQLKTIHRTVEFQEDLIRQSTLGTGTGTGGNT
jgi:serine/threonine protein kinase